MLVGSSIFTKGKKEINTHDLMMDGISIYQLAEVSSLKSLGDLSLSAKPAPILTVRVVQMGAILYQGEVSPKTVDDFSAPKFFSSTKEPVIIEITESESVGRPYYYCETDVLKQGNEYQLTFSFIYDSSINEIRSQLKVKDLTLNCSIEIMYEGGEVEKLFTSHYFSFRPIDKTQVSMVDLIKSYFNFINSMTEESGLEFHGKVSKYIELMPAEGVILLGDFLATLNADTDRLNPERQTDLLANKAKLMLEAVDGCLSMSNNMSFN